MNLAHTRFQLIHLISAAVTILLGIVLIVNTVLTDQDARNGLTALAQADTSNQIFFPLIKANHPWTNPVGVETDLFLGPERPITQYFADLGSSWVRLNARVSWRELQPNPGSPIQWALLADFETELETISTKGARPIVIIDDYPLWATTSPSSCSPIRPEYYDEFAGFVSQIVNEYKLSVKDWELGNEVDIDPDMVPVNSHYGCWGNLDDTEYYGGQQYGDMLKVVGPAIKAADPSARVWHGGLLIGLPPEVDPLNPKFLRGVLASGAGPYFDILPYHAHGIYYGNYSDSYIGGNPWLQYGWGDGVLGKANYLRQVMQEYGVDKPLMVNEITFGCVTNAGGSGVSCDPPESQFFELKADMSIRIATRVISDNMLGIIWYTLEGPGWRNGGLLNGDYSPQPAYQALKVLGEQITGAPYVGTVDYGNAEIEAYAFKYTGAKQLHIVWAKTNTTYTIDIPKAKLIEVVDRQGNTVTPTDTGSSYQISVGFSPLFIERLP